MKKIVHVMLTGPVTDCWSYQDNLLTKYHRMLGYEVTMITSQWIWNDQGELQRYIRSNYINENDVKVIRLAIKGWDNFRKKWKCYKNLYAVLEKESPDILFIHGCQFMDMGKIVKYLAKNPNITVYVDNHADFSNSGTNWISIHILHKIIWRHTAHLIEPYTSRFYGVLPARVEWLVDMYHLPFDKCKLLVMGADDQKIIEAENENARDTIRQNYHISADDFLIMTGGKIDAWKSQTLLLMEAVKNIKNKNIKLIVFGSVVPEQLEKVNQLNDGKKVQYIGWISPEQSYRLWSACDLAVFPGRHSVFWEQVSGIGIPMICKYWPGTTHVDVGGNVEFIMKDSTEEIQSIIEKIIDTPGLYEHMKQVAKSNGKKQFSYYEIAKRALEIN